MVVVPQDLMENLRYNQKKKAGDVGAQVLGVDKEMQSILTRSDLSQDDKIRLYNNALLKYGDITKKKLNVEDIPIPEEEEEDEWEDRIERQFTINNRNRALHVLEWIRSKGDMTWNDRGEIVGLPGSNILTLLDEVTRSQPHSKTEFPIGMVQFATKLKDSNLPRYLLSTHYQRYIDTPKRPRTHRLVSPTAKAIPTPPDYTATPTPSPVKEWLTPY